MEYEGGAPEWPYNGFIGAYETDSWQYARHGEEYGQPRGRRSSWGSGTDHRAAGKPPPGRAARVGDPVAAQARPPARRDAAASALRLPDRQAPLRRYTPEMVERMTGCPTRHVPQGRRDDPRQLRRDRTTSFAYAVAWTQHTYGPQIIGCCALLQLLLGNIGRPGGGIMALRGHATIQGSTDVPTLYHSIHGYMPAPSALKNARHAARLPGHRDAADGLLGQHAEVHRVATSSRCTATRRRRRTTSATTGTRRSSATTRTCRCSWRWTRAR